MSLSLTLFFYTGQPAAKFAPLAMSRDQAKKVVNSHDPLISYRDWVKEHHGEEVEHLQALEAYMDLALKEGAMVLASIA